MGANRSGNRGGNLGEEVRMWVSKDEGGHCQSVNERGNDYRGYCFRVWITDVQKMELGILVLLMSG